MLHRPAWLLIVLCAAVLLAIGLSNGFGQAQPAPSATPGAGSARAAAGSQPGVEGGAGGAGRFSLNVSGAGNERLIVVMDSDSQRLLVYSIDSSARPPLLKLVAVRNITHDIALEHWNNAQPYPDDVRRSLAGQAESDER